MSNESKAAINRCKLMVLCHHFTVLAGYHANLPNGPRLDSLANSITLLSYWVDGNQEETTGLRAALIRLGYGGES